MRTASTLSFRNLLTKKGRTIITAFAGSIGIIGVALVLALSMGLSGFMGQMQTESLAGFPISITEGPQMLEMDPRTAAEENPLLSRSGTQGQFTDENILYRYDSRANIFEHTSVLTPEYFDYIAGIQTVLPDEVNAVSYSRAVEINLLAKGEDSVVKYETTVRRGGGMEGEIDAPMFGDGIELTITGILRIKENSSSLISYLSPGLVYTTALTDYIVNNAENSEIAKAQMASDTDVILNTPFANDAEKTRRLLQLGADATPTGISIYPKDYAGKEAIQEYLDNFNVGKPRSEQIVYTDIAQMVEGMFTTMLGTVTYVLIGFAAISLVVSTIMIAIIIYVSVIERTKEIGILRSVGARKKDISRVFNAEAVLIGLVAGLLGIGISYLLTVPINAIIHLLVGVGTIANLTPLNAVLLVLGSMTLTLIAGFIPSRMAAKKDPVVALRTE